MKPTFIHDPLSNFRSCTDCREDHSHHHLCPMRSPAIRRTQRYNRVSDTNGVNERMFYWDLESVRGKRKRYLRWEGVVFRHDINESGSYTSSNIDPFLTTRWDYYRVTEVISTTTKRPKVHYTSWPVDPDIPYLFCNSSSRSRTRNVLHKSTVDDDGH